VEEELRDRERGARGLLGQQRVDVLTRMPRPRVPVGEGRDGDVDLRARLDPHGAGNPGDRLLGVRGPLSLDAVDELHELGGALQIAQEPVALGGAGRRIPAQGQKARDPRVEELPDERVGRRVGVADTRQVGQRRDGGLLQDVTQEIERAPAGRAARTVGHRDEPRSCVGEPPDRLVEREGPRVGLRRVHLERERHRRGAEIDRHDVLSGRGTEGRTAADGRATRRTGDAVSSRAGAGLGCRSLPGGVPRATMGPS
jgi:hypothetical protein